MAYFLFDVKAFLTARVWAPDEAAAREFLEELINHVEGIQANPHRHRGEIRGEIACASQDGNADLVEVDGEDLSTPSTKAA